MTEERMIVVIQTKSTSPEEALRELQEIKDLLDSKGAQ